MDAVVLWEFLNVNIPDHNNPSCVFREPLIRESWRRRSGGSMRSISIRESWRRRRAGSEPPHRCVCVCV